MRSPAKPSASALAVLAMAPLLALALACAPEGPPETGQPPETEARGSFGYETPPETAPPAEEEEPLLELSYEGGLIANPDPTPLVRVYPGGRVLVHYPAYMKRAGDYELQLGDDEIEDLLASFAHQEVLTAEPAELAAMTAEVRAEEGPVEGPVEPSDDHGVAAVVEVRADSFTPAGADAPTMLDLERRLVIEDMAAAEAATAPRFRPLRDLATGVRALEALAERSDLEPVAAAPATPEPPR